MVHPKSSWIALICRSPQYTTTASDCQTPSGQIPGDELEREKGGYGGKQFEKRRAL